MGNFEKQDVLTQGRKILLPLNSTSNCALLLQLDLEGNLPGIHIRLELGVALQPRHPFLLVVLCDISDVLDTLHTTDSGLVDLVVHRELGNGVKLRI